MPPRQRKTSRSPSAKPRKRAPGGPSDDEFREIFDEVDMDASGTINWFELQMALRKCGQDASKAKAMVAQADTDGDGEVDLDEFLDMMRSDFQTDEWLMFSTSVKQRLIRRAGAAYQSVVPVVPVVPLVGGAMYPFPDPEGCGHFGKAIVGGWIVSILASVLTGGIGIPVLIVLNLYFMAMQSSTSVLKLMGLKFVNMHGQDVPFCVLFAYGFCSIFFIMLFGIELLATLCDAECRPLSMQVMGLRFRRFDDTTPAGAVVVDVKRLPAATMQRLESGSSGGGIGIFMTVIIVLFVGAVAAVALSGIACAARCQAELGDFGDVGGGFDALFGSDIGKTTHRLAVDACTNQCTENIRNVFG